MNCKICKGEIKDNRFVEWTRGKIHFSCYSPDKQVDHDVVYGPDCSNERSAYWEFVEKKGVDGLFGDYLEAPEANPDHLPESFPYIRSEISEEQKEKLLFIGRSLHLLSQTERRVVMLLAQGFTQEQVGNKLGVTQQRVSVALSRARSKIGNFIQGCEPGFNVGI